MGLYLLGLHDIILIDIAPVMPALKHNLKKNKPVLKKALKTAQLYWANSAQITTLSPPFNVVIAADVVYMEESVRHLVDTMVGFLKDDGVVLLGYQLRSPEAHRLFWDQCNEMTFLRLRKSLIRTYIPSIVLRDRCLCFQEKEDSVLEEVTDVNESSS